MRRNQQSFPAASKIGSPVLDVIDESFEDVSLNNSNNASSANSIRSYPSQLKRSTSLYSQRSLKNTKGLYLSRQMSVSSQQQKSQQPGLSRSMSLNSGLTKKQIIDDRNATNFMNTSQRLKLKKRQQANQQQVKEKQIEIDSLIKNIDFLSDDELPDDLIVYDVPFARSFQALTDKENVFMKSNPSISHLPLPVPQYNDSSDPSSTSSSSSSLNNHNTSDISSNNGIVTNISNSTTTIGNNNNNQNHNNNHSAHIARSSVSSLSTVADSTRASSIFSFASEMSDLTDNERRLSSLSLDAKTLTSEFEQNKDFQKMEESIQRINYLKKLGNINRSASEFNQYQQHQQQQQQQHGSNGHKLSPMVATDSKEKLEALTITRPVNLPPKDKYESFKHKKDFETLLQRVVEKEANEHMKRNKLSQMNMKQRSKDAVTWRNKIIPKYNSMVELPSTRELWWRGIPTESLRAEIWCRQLGNKLCIDSEQIDNEVVPRANKIISLACDYQVLLDLNKNKRLEINRFENNNKDVMDLIKLVSLISKEIRICFPDLMIFQVGSTFESILRILLIFKIWLEETEDGLKSLLNRVVFEDDLLNKYKITHLTCVLFQNIKDETNTFIALSSLLTKKLPYTLMTHDRDDLHPEYLRDTIESFDKCLLKKNESVFNHFEQNKIESIDFLKAFIPNFFSSMANLPNVSRILDIYIFEGDSFLLRVMLSILKKINYKLFGSKEEILRILSSGNQIYLNSGLIDLLQNNRQITNNKNNNNNNNRTTSSNVSTHGFKYFDLGDEDEFMKDVRTILRI